MESGLAIWALGTVFLAAVTGINGGGAGGSGGSTNTCGFPAIFNFGDSNSDTGQFSAAFGETKFPNGMSFRNLSNRVGDGRLIIDFMAEKLGLAYLDAPMDAFGRRYRQGANFATGGARITPIVINGLTTPIHLDVQVSQFFLFKSRSIALHNQLTSNKTNPPLENNFPEPEVFSKALYTIDIGHNDITVDFYNTSIPAVVDQFYNSIQRLLGDGAKYLWVHNTGPHGCLPGDVEGCKNGGAGCTLDENGCVKRKNEQSQEFNKLLKERVYELRAKYPDTAITYVDIYSAKHSLIVNAKNLGFEDPFGYCSHSRDVNGTVITTACNDPTKYISWDSVHNTEAANRIVANLAINGSLSDPPALPLAEACHKP